MPLAWTAPNDRRIGPCDIEGAQHTVTEGADAAASRSIHSMAGFERPDELIGSVAIVAEPDTSHAKSLALFIPTS